MNDERGLTLVELLVGLTMGLFLIAGAGSMMAVQLQEQWRLQSELQVQQDVRAIAALLRRELGTAGAWAEPERGAWSPGAGKGQVNPYSTLHVDPASGMLSFAASQAAQGGNGPENHRLDDADRKAIRLRGHTLEFRADGGRFQPLNDPAAVAIRRFETHVDQTEQALEALCPQACDGWPNCPPRMAVRTLRVSLDAEATNDARVSQRWTWRHRLPSDALSGTCRP